MEKNQKRYFAFLLISFMLILPTCGGGGGGQGGGAGESNNNSENFLGWWQTNWSTNGESIDVKYTTGNNTVSETSSTTNEYDQYGVLIGQKTKIVTKGEDIYGRQQDLVTNINYTLGLKPVSWERAGTIIFPAGAQLEQSLSSITLDEKVSYQYNTNGQLQGGTYNAEISGHISTSSNKATYSGSVTGTPVVKNGQLLLETYTETIEYYSGDTLYAKTDRVISGASELLGGKWVTVRQNHETVTTYSSGSQRKSEIEILWPRDQNGVLTGKSGNGTVTGSEFINGQSVTYTGTVAVDYAFDQKRGWYKNGYIENRLADTALPKRLPFEIILVDDIDIF